MRQTSDRFPLEELFMALADRTRLRLLNLMSGGEICVCFLVAVLEEPQPKISRHLAYLRRVGLVQARRDGKWMHYRLTQEEGEPVKQALVEQILATLAADAQMVADRRALLSACCSTSPVLRNAPRPDLTTLA
jgi:ArsR family transcriptional regulator, arsenate/arsenite/antimonite-responsive transcriptional repressor